MIVLPYGTIVNSFDAQSDQLATGREKSADAGIVAFREAEVLPVTGSNKGRVRKSSAG
jgi:hypothetical protein